MKPETLHTVIHGLTKRETNSISRKFKEGKKTPDHALLFDRFLSHKKFDDRKIRGTEFKDSRKYNRYREILLEKIVFHLSRADEGLAPKPIVLKAIELGATNVARKVLTRGIDKAIESEDWRTGYDLFKIAQAIEHDFRVTLYQGKHDLYSDFFLEKQSRISQLEDLYLSSVKSIHGNPFEKRKILESISEVIRTKDHQSSKEWFWKEMLESIYFHYKEEYTLWVEKQLKLAEEIVDREVPLRMGLKIRTLNSGIRSAIFLNKKRESVHLLFALSKLTLANQLENHLVQGFQIKRMIDFGHAFNDIDRLEEGIIKLKNAQLTLPTWEILKYWYYVALTYFYNGLHSKGLKALNTLRQFPESNRRNLHWQPEVLRLLLYYSRYRGDEIDDLLLSAKRRVADLEIEYPSHIVQTIDRLSKAFDTKAISEELNRSLQRETLLLKNSQERRAGFYINFSAWIKSQQSNLPMKDFIEDPMGLRDQFNVGS